ncbi:UNKNOWN [Stylonychia lemnae]|uniref:Uncharacterized protein n=1 Tax=Stylonychia lemnae TaxID=5949 RepID=A0A078AQI1_STYLE|nr:UNKNOWN [Stylonychia lemnae]|eukprot:CDW84419.1 UNKNOWN [Stylonychia lemnae]
MTQKFGTSRGAKYYESTRTPFTPESSEEEEQDYDAKTAKSGVTINFTKGYTKHEDEVNKILGPVEHKIKKNMNSKLKKKYKQQKKQEEKKLMNRIGENQDNLYDFLQDFSSSDYETEEEEDQSSPYHFGSQYNRMQSQDTRFQRQPTVLTGNTGYGARDGFVNHYEDDKQSNYDFEQNKVMGKLLNSYKKFERRKVPKKPIYFQNPKIPIMISRDQLTIQFRDVMVFDSLDLKNKFKKIFSRNRGFADDDQSQSESETRKSQSRDRNENTDKREKIAGKITEHLKKNSFSAMSGSDKSKQELQKLMDEQKKRGFEKSTVDKKGASGIGLGSHLSKMASQTETINIIKTSKDKNQKKLESLKDEIKKNINKLEEIEKETKDQNDINNKIIVKDIENVQQRIRNKDAKNISKLKDSINHKLKEINENQDLMPSLDMIQKRERWMIQLKTHIGKFQSEVLAFSLKKYFNRWKKVNDEYKLRALELEKQQSMNQVQDDLKPQKKEKNNKSKLIRNEEQDAKDEDTSGYNQNQKQFEVFLPSERIKKKLIPNCYNIYRPKKDEM